MNAVTLDTLKLARSLREKANLSADQAEGFADALAEAMQGELATKADIGQVERKIEQVERSIREAELRLEKQIEASKAEILKWMFGSIGFQTVVVLGAVLTFARLIRP